MRQQHLLSPYVFLALALLCLQCIEGWMTSPSLSLGKIVSLGKIAQGFRPPRCRVLLRQSEQDDPGYFNLPAGSADSFSKNIEYTQTHPSTPEDKQLVLQAMLKAFDNLQDFEIRSMHDLIFLGRTPEHSRCQSNLVRLSRTIDSLQKVANSSPLGVDENLQDSYRSTLSEVRMYAKDADFFLPDGLVVEPSRRGFLASVKWPWSSSK